MRYDILMVISVQRIQVLWMRCFVRWEVPDVSKERDVRYLHSSSNWRLLEPWRWMRHYPLKHQEPLIQWHNITSLKTLILIRTDVRTSNLTSMKSAVFWDVIPCIQ